MDRKTGQLHELLDQFNLLPADAYRILALIDAGAELEAREDDGGNTMLHQAAFYGNAAPSLALIKAGAEIEAKNEANSCTPLHLAAVHGIPHIVLNLLEAGAKLETKSTDGVTALRRAVRARVDFNCLALFLAEGASVWTKDLSNRSLIPGANLRLHLDKWEPLRDSAYIPSTRDEVMHLVSVMPNENAQAIPEPNVRAKMLLDRVPYTPEVKALYEAVLGIQQPPEIHGLAEMRAAALRKGVEL